MEYTVKIPDKLLWTAEEASAMTGIGIKKVYQMMDDRQCDYVIEYGRRRFIHADRFRKFLGRINKI